MRQKKTFRTILSYALNEMVHCKICQGGIRIPSLHLGEVMSGNDPHLVSGEEVPVSQDGRGQGGGTGGKSSSLSVEEARLWAQTLLTT